MKKLILIATVAVGLSSLSAFAQGNFLFTGGARSVWDAFSNGVPRLQATENVAFLINLTDSTLPAIASINGGAGTATNGTSGGLFSSPALQQSYWNLIMTDPKYVVAIDSSTGLAAVAATANNGGFSYRTGATFPVNGSAAAGGTAMVYVIAWDKAYATPAAAAAANAALGWTSAFSYTYAAGPIGTPTSSVTGQLGVYTFVPEPTTFTLAGLGAAAMLILRRRQK